MLVINALWSVNMHYDRRDSNRDLLAINIY